MVPRLLLAAAILLSTVAARHRATLPPVVPAAPADSFSAARPDLVRSTHLGLDLTVDFDAKVIRGSVTHDIVNRAAASTFIVDTEDLDIDAVTADGQPATWHFGTPAATTTPMIIDIAPTTRQVRIDYRTQPASPALHC